jgi:short-subunit dehydrogenase involved in D-alanine esterification of teichoic acids
MNKVQAELAEYLSGRANDVYICESNLHHWQEAVSFMASICNSLTDDAKTRLITLMERVAKEYQQLVDNMQSV